MLVARSGRPLELLLVNRDSADHTVSLLSCSVAVEAYGSSRLVVEPDSQGASPLLLDGRQAGLLAVLPQGEGHPTMSRRAPREARARRWGQGWYTVGEQARFSVLPTVVYEPGGRTRHVLVGYRLDYEDALHLSSALRAGAKTIVSNGKDFDRTPLRRLF